MSDQQQATAAARSCIGCAFNTGTGYMLCSHPDSRPENPTFWENVEDYRCHTPAEQED